MTEHESTEAQPEYRLKLSLEERPPGASSWYHCSTTDRASHERETYLEGWTKQQALDGFDQIEAMLDSDFVADLVETANEWDEAVIDHEAHIQQAEQAKRDEADEAASLESNHS